MSNGGGNSFFESILDIGTQALTGGLIGFESDKGGVSTGVTSDVAISGLKEVTGAKAAEEANAQARKQFEDEQKAALQDRENAKAETAANQLAASRQAGAVRSTTNTSRGGSTFSDLGSDERDFLGL